MSERAPATPCEHSYPHVAHKYRNPNRGPNDPYALRCPGVKVPSDARFYKPAARYDILAELRKVAKYLGFTIGDWNADSQMWESGVGFTRPRRIEEYPENSRKAWLNLAGDLDTLISRLSAIREAAVEAVDHIERVEKARAAQRLDS